MAQQLSREGWDDLLAKNIISADTHDKAIQNLQLSGDDKYKPVPAEQSGPGIIARTLDGTLNQPQPSAPPEMNMPRTAAEATATVPNKEVSANDPTAAIPGVQPPKVDAPTTSNEAPIAPISAPTQATAPTGPAKPNELISAEKNWYNQTYGTPGQAGIAEIPAKPIYNKAQSAQIDALNKSISGLKDTLGKIGDSDINDETKQNLHFETLARIQKAEEQVNTINEKAATQNGMTKATPGKEAVPGTTGIIGKIEDQIKNKTAFDSKEAEDISHMLEDRDVKLNDNEVQSEAARKVRMQKTEAYVNQLNKQADDLANYNEDPNRLWNSKSGWQKALMSIALIFGGMNNKGINPALSVLNKHQDDDIAAQRANYDAKKTSFKAKQSLYGVNMDLYKDPEAALAASKVVLIDQSMRQIEQYKAKNESPRLQAQGDRALLELEQNRANAQKDFAYRMYQLQHPATGAGAGNGALKTEVVNEVADGFKVIDSYNHAANDIGNIAKGGDVNLNPSGLRKVGGAVTNFFAGPQAELETNYGKGGAAIIQRVRNVVQENPIAGEHSDADREVAIQTILGNGDPTGIQQRLQSRAQAAAKKVQIQTQSLSTKDQAALSNRVSAPAAATPVLAPAAPRQR